MPVDLSYPLAGPPAGPSSGSGATANAGTFARARLDELPVELNGIEGQGLAAAVGQAQDDEVALLRIAALSDTPNACPDDALDGLGGWYSIGRFAGESDAVYRARVTGAWPTWKEAAAPQAILDSLAAFGIPNVVILNDCDRSFWSGAWYSRFEVFLMPTGLPYGPLVAPFTAPVSFGTTATPDQVRAIKRQILKWKSATAYPVKIGVLLSTTTIVLGVNAVAPFTAGGPFVEWNLGRILTINMFSAPFICGGYDV